jgi:hypothetical protein
VITRKTLAKMKMMEEQKEFKVVGAGQYGKYDEMP